MEGSAAGVAFAVPAIIAMGDFSTIAMPGPIFGVIFGRVILGLGAAKGAMSARAEGAIPAQSLFLYSMSGEQSYVTLVNNR